MTCTILGISGSIKDLNTKWYYIKHRIHRFNPLSPKVSWRCNVCGATNLTRRRVLEGDLPTCAHCDALPRQREIVRILSTELFGKSLDIQDFPESLGIRGIGLSDWDGLGRLASKLSYTNTFYHKEPRLDICKPGKFWGLDFIIATEVFEHVDPPISEAFRNAWRMLKPGGVMIFSAPYKPAGETIEHTLDPDYLNHPISHGGDGAVIEMRLFSKPSLITEFRRAGFKVTFYGDDDTEHGLIYTKHTERSIPLAARKLRGWCDHEIL